MSSRKFHSAVLALLFMGAWSPTVAASADSCLAGTLGAIPGGNMFDGTFTPFFELRVPGPHSVTTASSDPLCSPADRVTTGALDCPAAPVVVALPGEYCGPMAPAGGYLLCSFPSTGLGVTGITFSSGTTTIPTAKLPGGLNPSGLPWMPSFSRIKTMRRPESSFTVS